MDARIGGLELWKEEMKSEKHVDLRTICVNWFNYYLNWLYEKIILHIEQFLDLNIRKKIKSTYI